MTPIITAFERSPDRGRGLARDMRIRWALEEVGRPYDVRLLSFEAMKAPEHMARHPFGQIPTYEEDGLVLFESGAILLHIAETHGALAPSDPAARARAIGWLFAALNTVEPPVFERSLAGLFERDKPWAEERLAALDRQVRTRLEQLAAHLGQAKHLDGGFSLADIAMVTVLRRADAFGGLEPFPTLKAYVARAEARPAYVRAFAAQQAVFEASGG